MEAGDVIAEVENPEGRLVRVDSVAWNHVLEEHPDLEPFLSDRVVTAFPQGNDPTVGGRRR